VSRSQKEINVHLTNIGKSLVAAASVLAVAGLTACGSDSNTAATSTSAAGSAGGTSSADCGGKDKLSAEGSTAQQNAIGVFNQVWGQKCPGKNLSYNPTGSGAGVNQFIAGQVDFAGTDSPLSKDQPEQAAKRCGGNPAWNLPLVFGPVALAYNLPGVDKLVLNAEVLAKIFSGGITSWDDPAIAALNSGATLPATKIVPIYRSDSSGTTDNFQLYLETAAKDVWTKGAGKEFQGGAGEGAQKSAGVVQAVQATPGGIGYVEKGFVTQAGLPMAQIDNGSGAVELTDASAGKAIEGAVFAGEGNDLVLDLKSIYGTTAPGAYPLVLATYQVVCSKGYPAETAAAVKSFMSVSADYGQAGLSAAGFIPLPDAFRQRLSTAVNAIQ
jgi:phosphate transport system substrate-binding protein